MTFPSRAARRASTSGFRWKNTKSILLRLAVAPTHSYLRARIKRRVSVISDIDGYILLSGSFADAHDSSRGGINHSAGPSSVRKTPTTYRKRNFTPYITGRFSHAFSRIVVSRKKKKSRKRVESFFFLFLNRIRPRREIFLGTLYTNY